MAFRNLIDSSIVGFGSSSTISAAMHSPETNKEAALNFINEIYDVVVKVSRFVVTKCMLEDQLCLIISHQMSSSIWHYISMQNFGDSIRIYCEGSDERS